MKKSTKPKYIIGIDEVGRGPLAGPVAVGAVLIYAEHHNRVTKLFPVVKDSKKLSAKSREKWIVKIREAEEAGFLGTAVAFVAPSSIPQTLSKAFLFAPAFLSESFSPLLCGACRHRAMNSRRALWQSS